MNKAVVGAVALVAVAGAGVGMAAWSGSRIGTELQAQTDKVLAPFPGVKIVENSVTKGLFSSTHTVTLEAGCAPQAGGEAAAAAAAASAPADGQTKPLRITWRDHVQHGPLPGFRGVGLAVIDSELVLPPEVATPLAKALGDQPPFKAHTSVGFGGKYVSEVSSPAFKMSEAGKGDLDWQGVRMTVHGDLTRGIAAGGSYTMEAPGATFNMVSDGQAAGTVRLGRVAIQAEVLPNDGSSMLVAPSRGTGSIDLLALSFKRPGEPDAKPVDIAFENLQLSSDTKVDAGLLSQVSKISMKGRFDQLAFDKVDLQASMSRLHVATYAQLLGRAMQQSFGCHKPGDPNAAEAAVALAADMQKGFGALLAYNPEYSLDRLAIEMGGKTAEIAYAIGLKGVSEADAALPVQALLFSKGYGTASFKVQTGWIEQLVRQVTAMKAASDGSSAEAAAAGTLAAINATVDDLVAKGFLAREGDVIRSKAAFEQGVVKVNDQPMDIPLGAMLAK